MINKIKIEGRTCGDCKECCTIMSVAEINKPLRVVCEHVCEQGCGIYNERPPSCRSFECAWLTGWIGNEDYRPDQFGLMVTVTIIDFELVVNVWEVWKDASLGERQQYFLKKFAKRTMIMVRKFGGGVALYGRRDLIEQFRKKHGLG